ncbi:MAG: hypothetical protein K2H55_09030 [Helicobacter sp.]|nr:hypothetical protein [Helicobacter sp.]
MDTFSLRMNLGVSKNRLASLHNRQNAAQTQAVASRDMGAHIKEGLGANNGGRANLGLLVGVDIATQFDPFGKKESETRLQNASNNLAIAQTELELASAETSEERRNWLKTTLQELRVLSEELQKTLEQIAKEREKERNPLAIGLDSELTAQDEARIRLQELNETQRAETKMAYMNAKEVASVYQGRARQILRQIAQLQKEILNDSVQIAHVLAGNAPSVDFSVNLSAGGDGGGLVSAIDIGTSGGENVSTESPSTQTAANGASMATEAEAAESPEQVAPTNSEAPRMQEAQNVQGKEAPKEPQQTSGAKQAPKTQGAKPIDTQTLNSLSMQRSAKMAKIMELYEQLAKLDQSSSGEASKIAEQSDSRNRAAIHEAKALKEIIYG